MKLSALTRPSSAQLTATCINGAATNLVRQWHITKLSSKTTSQRRSLSLRAEIEDEGSWSYSPEWWGTNSDHLTNSVFRATSNHGNGLVSVLAYPSSSPSPEHRPKTEEWLRKRCAEICSDLHLKVLGYQWRVLRFNYTTRQSTAKVMAFSEMSDPGSVYYMQQPHCLAKSYIKSMVSAGLTTLSSSNYDLLNAANGKRQMRVLCIGHGGGSLPLFIASKIQGAVVDTIEIDPAVIAASVNAMGFPSFSVSASSGHLALSRPITIDEVLWRGIHERLFLYESDAENFILNTTNLYDIIFIDTYDGDNIFPRKLWEPYSPFLGALGSRVHPDHGTVVVNLHSSAVEISPEGRIVSAVCQAYKDMLVGMKSSRCGELGSAFVVSVPWVRNVTLVVSRGIAGAVGALDRGLILNSLMSKTLEVERDLDFPFSCSEYLEKGFRVLD